MTTQKQALLLLACCRSHSMTVIPTPPPQLPRRLPRTMMRMILLTTSLRRRIQNEKNEGQHTVDVKHPCCLYKKAQLGVGELHPRFRDEDELSNFVDRKRLTAYKNNVICATLRYTENLLSMSSRIGILH